MIHEVQYQVKCVLLDERPRDMFTKPRVTFQSRKKTPLRFPSNI